MNAAPAPVSVTGKSHPLSLCGRGRDRSNGLGLPLCDLRRTLHVEDFEPMRESRLQARILAFARNTSCWLSGDGMGRNDGALGGLLVDISSLRLFLGNTFRQEVRVAFRRSDLDYGQRLTLRVAKDNSLETRLDTTKGKQERVGGEDGCAGC